MSPRPARRRRPWRCRPGPVPSWRARTGQTANRIRGPCAPRPRPALEKVLGPRLARDAVLETIAARRRPHRTEEGRQGTYRCQAEEARSPAPCRLGPAGLRRPGQADGSPRRHRRGRGGPAPPGPPGSSPCTPRGPSTATVPGAHHPCPAPGSRPPPSSWPRHWAGPPPPEPSRPHTPAWRR